ncbi:hypothetical protein KSD_63680 [Ktedonobacter sp. SOSP1-85]|nr:hypothetical protein KSD_63680 [Ktedonobacter sp. SOSP1-85]
MVMIERMLAPLDGSARSEEALTIAGRLARATGASLLLMRVITPEQFHMHLHTDVSEYVLEEARKMYLEEAETYLKQVMASSRLQGVRASSKVVVGLPGDCILRQTQEYDAQLIVMCSHGERAEGVRWLMGSVAQYVERQSPVPVLIVRDERFFTGLRQGEAPGILCALDGSPYAETVLQPAAELAQALAQPEPGRIHLMYAVKVPSATEEPGEAQEEAATYLKACQERFQTGDLKQYELKIVSSIVTYRPGEPLWQKILATSCYDTQREIIAMATHGREGLPRLRQGSVTEDVLQASSQPLLIVHPQPADMEHVTQASKAKHQQEAP